MTSNLGSQIIQQSYENMKENGNEEVLEETRFMLLELLRKSLRPEFLNRIDETIIFTPLSKENIREIVRLQFQQIVERMKHQGIDIRMTDAAVQWIGAAGFDPQYGARPVKRILQKQVLNELSKIILAGEVVKNKPITIDIAENRLVFTNE